MSAKASVSLSDQQERFARDLVAKGRFSSLSAVVQHGLDLVRQETELNESVTEALRVLLEERARGSFVTMDESDREIEAIIAEKKAANGL